MPSGRFSECNLDFMPDFTTDDGTKLYYETRGSGHALLVEQGMFAPTIAARAFETLAEQGFWVVVYDGRGVGRSERPRAAPGSYSIDRLTQDSLALTDHLGLENVIALGWFDGAHRAVRRALERPEATPGLILCGPCLSHFDNMLVSGPMAKALAELFRAGFNYGVSAYIDSGMPDATEEQKTLAKTTFRDSATLEVANAIWSEVSRTDDLPLLASVSCPTLVVAGTSDVVVPSAHSRAVARALPNGQLVELQGAGNAMWFTRTEETLAAISEFAGSLELRSSARRA
jgi:pimeloyl-ACP methyl ester carboxylesterase